MVTVSYRKRPTVTESDDGSAQVAEDETLCRGSSLNPKSLSGTKKPRSRFNHFNSATQTSVKFAITLSGLRPTVKIFFCDFLVECPAVSAGHLEILISQSSGGQFDLFAAVLSHKERVEEIISLRNSRKSFLQIILRVARKTLFLWAFLKLFSYESGRVRGVN